MKQQWWHDKIFYQIYPKSFYDTNGDGIGDINGIISKLDYLKDLGIDVIWISPMYKSPFIDQGYDIANYREIDPMFGSLEDLDRLLAEAKKRDMFILMDLVVNHCSSEHEWFINPEYKDYFYIESGVDGKAPNNLRSYFGGSAWTRIGETDEYYLHLFDASQPDLNWENPKVVAEIYDMVNWWLKRGIAGFRIDAIVNIQKELPFKNYAPDRIDGLAHPGKMLANASGLLDKLYDLKRNTFDKFNALAIAELFDYDSNQIASYIGDNGCFDTIFDFETTVIGASVHGWHANTKPTAEQYKKAIYNSQRKVADVGFLCNIIENHDEPRGATRYLNHTNDYSKKMLATITIMLRGIPFLYQGQEIGMENTTYNNISELNDIFTIGEYNIALEHGKTEQEAMAMVNLYSRDHSRTPIPWNSSTNGGFTSGQPWLALNPNYTEINVEEQIGDENSVFNFYKQLIALRKNPKYKEVLVNGSFVETFEFIENLVAFLRILDNHTILTLANFSNHRIDVPINKQDYEVLINNYESICFNDDIVTLGPYQSLVLYQKTQG